MRLMNLHGTKVLNAQFRGRSNYFIKLLQGGPPKVAADFVEQSLYIWLEPVEFKGLRRSVQKSSIPHRDGLRAGPFTFAFDDDRD